ACAQAPKQRDVPVGSSPSAPEREEDAGVCQRLLLGKQGRYLWKVVCWWPPSSQEGEPASEKIAQRHLGRCGRARKIRTMPHSSDSSDSSFSRSPPPGKQDSSDDVRKVQRREKNRIAAQKSRQRQTQKADTLHLESEDLEKQNAALRKEIKQLTEELKYFTSVLSSHEPLCSVLASGTPSPPEVVYSAHAFHQPHISSPRFQP
ncbi:basic leucine zipper transcription factor, ATF-like, partial [Mus musculus]